MKAEEDRAIERRLGMMPTLEEPSSGRGRPPKMFKRGPLIREHGAAPLERPFTRPRADADNSPGATERGGPSWPVGMTGQSRGGA